MKNKQIPRPDEPGTRDDKAAKVYELLVPEWRCAVPEGWNLEFFRRSISIWISSEYNIQQSGAPFHIRLFKGDLLRFGGQPAHCAPELAPSAGAGRSPSEGVGPEEAYLADMLAHGYIKAVESD